MHLNNESTEPSVTVIIVNYNQKRHLRRLITSVLSTSYSNFHVVIVDNASIDGSRQLLNTFNDERLSKILLQKNVGLCEARNLGANYQQTDYFAFLDPDVIVTPKWLQRLVNAMESDIILGIAESNIISKVDWAASSNQSLKLYALGAAFIIRNKLWRRLDGFDSDYFIGYDDQDLGWRTWLLGYKVSGILDSIFYHFPGSLRSGELKRFFYIP